MPARKAAPNEISPERRQRGRPKMDPADLQAAHAATRDRICEASLALFDRGGIEAISMREVAKELGVSPMMTYKYFPSKDHLLQELRTRAFRQLEAVLKSARDGGDSAEAALEAVLVGYLEFGHSEPRAYRLMFDYWVYDNPQTLVEEFGEDARLQSGPWRVLLEGLERFYAETGTAGDPLVSAHLTWSALHGLVSLEVSRKLVFGLAFEDLARPMARTILRGLRP